jgi:ATP-dependent DNA helicase PIF1
MVSRYFNTGQTNENTELPVVLKLAPTGVAAFRINGLTIHGAMALGFKGPTELSKISGDTLNRLVMNYRRLKLIIIDEISMVGITTLKNLHIRLCQIARRDPKTAPPFAGMHIIFCGDFFQLRPVNDKFVFQEAYSPLWHGVQLYELHRIMRQKDMQHTIYLNQMRENNLDVNAIRHFLSLRRRVPELGKANCMHLYARNEDVNKHNTELFEEFNGTKYIIPAQDLELNGVHIQRSRRPKFHLKERGWAAGNLPDEIQLYVSCMCMVVCNVDVSDGIVNGAQGIVKHVTCHGHSVHTIWVHFHKPTCGEKLRQKNNARYERHSEISRSWTPLTAIKREIQHGQTRYSRKQFPIVMRNASTIHKTQGNEFQEGIVDFKGPIRKGMAYVSISRFLHPDKLELRNFDPSKVSVDQSVLDEYARLRASPLLLNPLSLGDSLSTNQMTKSIYFQNVNGYKSKLKYLTTLPGIQSASCLCFVETHHCDKHPTPFPGFEHMLHIPNKHAGIIVVSKHTLTCVAQYMSVTGSNINILLFHMGANTDTTYVIGYFHAKCNYKRIERALTHCFDVDTTSKKVILGDFNVKRTSSKYPLLQKYFDRYNCQQLVGDPTTLKGTTIDHLWTNTSANVIVHETYFSDHFPLIARITDTSSHD